MWGYLSEFWSSITQVVIEAGTYTIDWFQSVGNAVAGAIGGLFEDLIHHFYDIFYAVQWLLDGLQNFFSIIFSPVVWTLNFGKGFITSAFSSPEELGLEIGDVGEISGSVFAFFSAIPYFNYIFLGLSAILGLFFLIIIIKKLSAM